MVLSTRCFKSADFTEPITVTLPLSTSVLTSKTDRVESEASAFSMLDWMVASSRVTGDASPPPSDGDEVLLGVAGVGVILPEGLGDGVKLGPAGTTCSGPMLAFIGSKGRLVRYKATKVANAAAIITLIAAQISGLRCARRFGPRAF